MIKLLGLIVFVALLGTSKADYCQDNFTLSEFPEGILKNVLSILTTGTVNDFFGCSGDNEVYPDEVRFWFDSRNNSETIVLDPNNPVEVQRWRPTKILIHGWLCNVTSDRMPQLKDAYLQRYDANVIRVEWTTLAVDLYTESFCKVPGVAKLIGAFICKLNSDFNVDLEDVHLVGHSMGGQISGLTGQEVQSQCSKSLGRITGLDPAGPLYQFLPPIRRLDSSDALHVDVIHTNEGSAGYFGPCGDLDFFPNCGTLQPGCLEIHNATNLEEIINLPLNEVSCNHLRSCDYMIESINPKRRKFESTSCTGCPLVCGKDILFPKHELMGEECGFTKKASHFHLKTKGQSPFARG